MLEKNQFEEWINASHKLYDIFEQRYDAYPLAVKWVQQWHSFGKFIIETKEILTVERLVHEFNCDAFRNIGDSFERDNEKWNKFAARITERFKAFVKGNIKTGESKDIGKAVSLYLLTWNFQRFKEYFKNYEQFDLEHYFKELGAFLEIKKTDLKHFQEKSLVSDQIQETEIIRLFGEINAKLKELGKGQNEPVGTAKILHIFAPNYFPLIDNSEAQAIGLTGRQESLTVNHYLTWMGALKRWLQNYVEVIRKLEKQHNFTIIRLVDEGLYLMSTVKQRTRVAELGINCEG
ncbi:hypothetical protein HXY32_03840 [Candidatus Bathyarchaeota archaeon]|nr:hypothetical protein [Candidatus Bathyarchaeota archaeon]